MRDPWRHRVANRVLRASVLTLGLAAALLGTAARAESPQARVALVSRVADSQISDTPGADSYPVSLSADGRFVLFTSLAANVVPGQRDTNGALDVFLLDRATGTTTLVSHAAGAPSTASDSGFTASPILSADGRWAAYVSTASNLVPGLLGAHPFNELVLYDRITDTTTLVCHAAGSPATPPDGACGNAALSADGRYLAFESNATNLVPGPSGEATQNVFLYDRVTDQTVLVSHDPASAVPATPRPEAPSLSADGRFVLFRSYAGPQPDLYQYDRTTGINTLVSHQSGDPAARGNGASRVGVMSADGGTVTFVSLATDLLPGPTFADQVFLWDRLSGAIRLVSHVAGDPLRSDCCGVGFVNLSADGGTVVFDGRQRNLVPGPADTYNQSDVFLYHRATETTTRATEDRASTLDFGVGIETGVSADGQRVLIHSGRTDLVPGLVDGNGDGDLFLYVAGTAGTAGTAGMALVSHTPGSRTTAGNAGSTGLLSADGRTVALDSSATDLAAGLRDTNAALDLFLYDAGSAQITPLRRAPDLPSLSAGGTSAVSTSPGPSVSANGRWLAFVSDAAALVAGQDDANGGTDVFLRDTQTGTTVLVSHAAGSPARAANGRSDAPAIDRDGRYVAFESTATDLVPGQQDGEDSLDAFLYDRVTGATVLVSHASAGANVTAGGELPVVSANGKVVAFQSAGDAVVPGQVNGTGLANVFLYDREGGSIAFASRRAGTAATAGAGESVRPALSADGRFVAFLSSSPDLVPGDTNQSVDIFLFDRAAGTTTLVSRSAAFPGQTANGDSLLPVISADGRFVAFVSLATDLVPGGSPDFGQQVYLYDRVSRRMELASHAAGSPGTPGNGPSDQPALDAEGRFLVFTSEASNLTVGSPAAGNNVFLYDRANRKATRVDRPFPGPNDGDSFSSGPAAISADGRRVAFTSQGTNLVPGQADANSIADLFLYDRAERTTVLLDHRVSSPVAVAAAGADGPFAFAANGRCVAFESPSSDLVSFDFNERKDVFLACLGGEE
jgi:Tol biopolymer transport system component